MVRDEGRAIRIILNTSTLVGHYRPALAWALEGIMTIDERIRELERFMEETRERDRVSDIVCSILLLLSVGYAVYLFISL